MTKDLQRDQFEQRKRDHIQFSLDDKNEAFGGSSLQNIELLHEAIPELNFNKIQLTTKSLNKEWDHPFFVSSMTAGHEGALKINHRLALLSASRGWAMGVGSQRKELFDKSAAEEWKSLRKEIPKVRLMGNLGLAQLIETPIDAVERLVDSLEAEALFIHTNPLQESLQPEGTPNFKDGWKALNHLSEKLSVPVILKETGCGFSKKTLIRLKETQVAAVDVSGFGGTHWGRIEGERSPKDSIYQNAAQSFSDWGISTVDSLLNAKELDLNCEVWASGGVRSGLDAAKLVAMGAQRIGVAKPLLKAALDSELQLDKIMEQFEFELKVALFCTGFSNLTDFQKAEVWTWKKN